MARRRSVLGKIVLGLTVLAVLSVLFLRTLRESGGAAVAVPDGSIVPAMRRLARIEGIDACPEGAATFVGLELLLADGAIRPHERIVLFNTGTGLKHPELRPGVP